VILIWAQPQPALSTIAMLIHGKSDCFPIPRRTTLISGAASYQHRDVEFAEIQTDVAISAPAFSVTWAPDGNKAIITGHCPECYGPTKNEFDTGIPDTKFR